MSIIRLFCDTRPQPSVPAVDSSTGQAPEFWRGDTVEIDVGIFDQYGAPVSMANIQYVQLDILDSNLTSSAEVLLTQTTDALASITRQGWLNGREQNAVFKFSPSETAISTNGQESRKLYLVCHGIKPNGDKVTFGACIIKIYDQPATALFMPSYPVPLVIPEAAIYRVGPNAQVLFGAPIDCQGTLDIEGVLIDA